MINYVEFNAGKEEYKLAIPVRDIVALEKKLGCNPMAIFGDIMNEEFQMPTITEMVTVLQASLQKYHHGVSLDKACAIFEDYLADGHDQTEFVNVITDVYKVSGIIPKKSQESEAKN